MIHNLMAAIVYNKVYEQWAFVIIDLILFVPIIWLNYVFWKRKLANGWSLENAKWKLGMQNNSIMKQTHRAENYREYLRKAN